jgi:hypothetical protein
MKRETARLGVIYASNKLGLEDGIEVLYRDRDFFQFDHQGAIFIPATYTIIFNTDWLNSIHDEEILRCAFHETRHAYQRACIDFPDMMVLDVEEETVKKWKFEFDNYTHDESKGYDFQELEKDANEFADRLLLELHNES